MPVGVPMLKSDALDKAQKSIDTPDVQQWYGTHFTNNKAGMAAVDKEKVKKVVYEMSKASFRSIVCRLVLHAPCLMSTNALASSCQRRCLSARISEDERLLHVNVLQDTPHFKHGLRLQGQTEERIKRMKQQASALTPSELACHTRFSCSPFSPACWVLMPVQHTSLHACSPQSSA